MRIWWWLRWRRRCESCELTANIAKSSARGNSVATTARYRPPLGGHMLTSRYAPAFALLGLFLVAAPAAAQDSATPPAVAQSPSTHRFWFNVGAGYGSLGCQDCFGRLSGLSGNLSLGA